MLPDIPRVYTGIAEWAACMVYILLIGKRMRWAPFVATATAGLGALIGVQLLAGLLPLGLWTFGMAMAVVTMFGFIMAAANVTTREAGDLLARGFVLAELVASLQWQLQAFFYDPGTRGSGPIIVLVGVYGFGFGLAYLAERGHFPREHRLPIDNRGLVGAAAIAIVTFLMSNLSFVTTSTPFSGRSGSEIFYIRTLVDLCGFVVLYALRGQRLALQRATEANAASMTMRHQQERYLQAKSEIDTVNRKYHDLKHYIHAIRAEADPGKRAAFVDQLEDSVRGYEGAMLNTGSPVLDAILTSKQQRCDNADITLTVVADGSAVVHMEPMDLVTIVGNALDNAIEAVERLTEPERRLIRVAIYRQNRLAMIIVENYFEGPVTFRDGLPQTTKANALQHGYGVRNMRDTAQQSGGSLTARAENGWFSVRALIPLPDDKHRSQP